VCCQHQTFPKAAAKTFTRWIAGLSPRPGERVDPALVALYQRAVVCRWFPAYKLEDLTNTPAIEILRAIRLLTIADQVR
jgi:hypothetical protein